MAKRRKYSEEFKREAVALTRQPGASVSEVARDIGVGSKETRPRFLAREWQEIRNSCS
jgi:transposase-like protein